MAANRKPGNPWNQFSKKKKPPSSIVKRTPKPDVKPSNALKPAPERPALPPAKPRNTTPKPAPKRLPAATKGGQSATSTKLRGWGNVNDPNSTPQNSGRPRGPSSEQRAANNSRGGALQNSGPTVDVKANMPKLPPGRSGGALAETSAGALARVSRAAESVAKNAPKARGALSGLRGGLLASALYEGGSRAIQAGVGAYKNAIRAERGQRAGESGQSGRYIPGSQQSRGGMGGVGNIPPGEGPRNNPNYGKPAPKPVPRTTSSNQSTPSRQARAGSAGTNTSTPRPIPSTNSRPAPAANAGMKNQDKNFRGNLFEKTFGYKPGNAPDQTRARQDKAANPSNFDTKSDTYQPQTKVDGSQYADKKPDMKKVNEYDRRKRRYYD